jgi:hypothetical protein
MRDSLCTLLHALAPRTTSAGPTCSSTCCPRCGGKMRLVALVQEPENIARYLRHLGLTTEVPPMAPLSGLGPARPAPAPRGFAAPVACPWATVLAEPRPPPPPRSATRHGSNVAGARHRRSDRLPPARPLATGQAPVCPETRNPFRWPSMASVFRPDPPAPPHLPASIVSSPRYPTRPEGVYFSYGLGRKFLAWLGETKFHLWLTHPPVVEPLQHLGKPA